MYNKLDYLWRMFATGFCFMMFSLGALLLSLLVFPFLFLLPASARPERARRIISLAFRLLLWLMQSLGLLKIDIVNQEKLAATPGCLVLANHPTLIDVVVLMALMPNTNCVVKQALWQHVFIGGVVKAANYISNDDPETLVAQCADDIAQGTPLIIFPEGTRSVPGKSLKFKRGAAYIAMHGKLPVTPVLISCSPPTLTKGEKWYKIPPRKVFLHIRILDPIRIDQWANPGDPPSLAARQVTNRLEQYFTEALSTHGSTTSGDQGTHHQSA